MHIKRRVADLNFKCEQHHQHNHQDDGDEKKPAFSVNVILIWQNHRSQMQNKGTIRKSLSHGAQAQALAQGSGYGRYRERGYLNNLLRSSVIKACLKPCAVKIAGFFYSLVIGIRYSNTCSESSSGDLFSLFRTISGFVGCWYSESIPVKFFNCPDRAFL